MARTASQVAAWAKDQKDRNTTGWTGLCLKFARMAAGGPGGQYDANAGWAAARYKHRGDRTAPRGSIVWYAGGNHGHVAVSAGNGDIYSTDIVTRGQVDQVPLGRPESKWGQTYRGWTEDVNGVHIAGLGRPVADTGSGGTSAVTSRTNIADAWYHVDPSKVASGLNWYDDHFNKRGVRPPNFDVHLVATVMHDGHKFGVTDSGNHYRFAYLAEGKH